MQRRLWPQALRAAGLTLLFGAAQLGWGQLGIPGAFAQSAPATTPSTPPVTTPPPPGMAPPTGGPNSLPTREPANAIEKGDGPGKAASPFTEAEARNRLQHQGYHQISGLAKDQDGVWRASATRNGRQVHVGLDGKGNISTN